MPVFQKRYIQLNVVGETVPEFNDKSIEGLRTSARIAKVTSVGMTTAEVTVYGLTLSTMNQLSTYGQKVDDGEGWKELEVYAGDIENGTSLVFSGTIVMAWVDAQSAPLGPFHFLAHSGKNGLMDTTNSGRSYDGDTDVASIFSELAGQMGLQLINDAGVNTKVSSPHLKGSVGEQLKSLAYMANVGHAVDNGKLTIWPAGVARPGGGFTVSRETGMVGYPAFNAYGVIVKQEFSTSAGHDMDVPFYVFSEGITKANDIWYICGVDYELDANVPRGKWFVTINGSRNPLESDKM